MTNTCCICRKSENTQFFKVYSEITHYKCKECNLIFSSFIPDDQEHFFEQSSDDTTEVEYWSTPELFIKHDHIFEHFFKERIRRINAQGIKSGKALDIGTGFGLWTHFLKKKGFEVQGIEINKSIARYTQDKYQIPVSDIPIEEFNSDEKFDLICIFDVLEHLEEPEVILSKLKTMLTPKGILYIQVPNVIGLKYPYNHGLGLPYHIWQFDPQTLKKLCLKSGLKPVNYWTGIQGVIGAYENNKVNLFLKFKWAVANILKRGNRVQLICR